MCGTVPGEMHVFVFVCSARGLCVTSAAGLCSSEVVESSQEVSDVAARSMGLIYCRI